MKYSILHSRILYLSSQLIGSHNQGLPIDPSSDRVSGSLGRVKLFNYGDLGLLGTLVRASQDLGLPRTLVAISLRYYIGSSWFYASFWHFHTLGLCHMKSACGTIVFSASLVWLILLAPQGGMPELMAPCGGMPEPLAPREVTSR
jgi:hypothetical protein